MESGAKGGAITLAKRQSSSPMTPSPSFRTAAGVSEAERRSGCPTSSRGTVGAPAVVRRLVAPPSPSPRALVRRVRLKEPHDTTGRQRAARSRIRNRLMSEHATECCHQARKQGGSHCPVHPREWRRGRGSSMNANTAEERTRRVLTSIPARGVYRREQAILCRRSPSQLFVALPPDLHLPDAMQRGPWNLSEHDARLLISYLLNEMRPRAVP